METSGQSFLPYCETNAGNPIASSLLVVVIVNEDVVILSVDEVVLHAGEIPEAPRVSRHVVGNKDSCTDKEKE
jgi:hypothetical protein